MLPRHKALALGVSVLVLAALAGAAGQGTLAAFTSQTSNSVSTLTSAPDWTAPTISGARIMKNSGYSADFIKQGGGYYVYADVSDSGNPAAGVSSVTANVGNITSGATAVTMSSGSWTVEGTTYNYRSNLQTANASLTAGAKTFSVTAGDGASNSASLTNQTVTVDNTAPSTTGADIQLVNNGATAGEAETGDDIVFTYSEQMDPGSILPSAGWTGTSIPVTVRFLNANPDTIQVWNQANSTQTMLGTVTMPRNTYWTGATVWTGSTMVQSGATVTVTLGTPDVPSNLGTVSQNGSTTWAPSASSYDRAANNFSGTSVTETGTDREF